MVVYGRGTGSEGEKRSRKNAHVRARSSPTNTPNPPQISKATTTTAAIARKNCERLAMVLVSIATDSTPLPACQPNSGSGASANCSGARVSYCCRCHLMVELLAEC